MVVHNSFTIMPYTKEVIKWFRNIEICLFKAEYVHGNTMTFYGVLFLHKGRERIQDYGEYSG
ncbi:hypothetical protein GCM10023260_06700 [Bartonella acomydis]|uniref:Uncharacterized protein n=1 Tax=Bartonella acomydis TaxID=686234 RepID=A0ABP9MIV4_9HYPH